MLDWQSPNTMGAIELTGISPLHDLALEIHIGQIKYPEVVKTSKGHEQ